MDQDRAVQAMMLEVKYENKIPEEYQGFVRTYLHLMFVVGYDEGNKWLKKPRTSPVIRIDEYGNEKRFESIIEAAHKTKCNPVTISKAIKFNIKRIGYYWKYADS